MTAPRWMRNVSGLVDARINTIAMMIASTTAMMTRVSNMDGSVEGSNDGQVSDEGVAEIGGPEDRADDRGRRDRGHRDAGAGDGAKRTRQRVARTIADPVDRFDDRRP